MPSLQLFINRMRFWCADADLGYDQSNRWDIRPGGECDCSSLVIFALQEAGFDVGNATYSGNLSENLVSRGWSRTFNDGFPQPGDILLNDVNHVAVWLGNCIAQASHDENGNIAGGEPGDQGGETVLVSYYDYPWDCYLRYTAEPQETTNGDDDMVCIFRPNGESGLIYYDGSAFHTLAHPDEATAIDMVYQQTHGGEHIPMFELGSPDAPWATRFMEAATR